MGDRVKETDDISEIGYLLVYRPLIIPALSRQKQ